MFFIFAIHRVYVQSLIYTADSGQLPANPKLGGAVECGWSLAEPIGGYPQIADG